MSIKAKTEVSKINAYVHTSSCNSHTRKFRFHVTILIKHYCLLVEVSLYLSMEMNDVAFLKLGNVYTDTKSTLSQYVALRRFKSFFGVTPQVCSLICKEVEQAVPSGGQPKHLLWCLCFLKQYSVEHNRRAIFHADEKTIRKWTWIFVELLSELNVVKLIFLIPKRKF